MHIVVPPDIESALAEHAEKRGTAPEELALQALRERFVPFAVSSESVNSLADFLAGHIGVLSSSDVVTDGANMSENGGRKFTDILIDKRKHGRL